MILTTMNQARLAQLLAAQQRQRGLALAAPPPRSAIVAGLLSQSQSRPDAFMEGINSAGESIAGAIKKRKKKKPVRNAIPQFDVDPSGLGLVRRR